jgi:hypothetical protein
MRNVAISAALISGLFVVACGGGVPNYDKPEAVAEAFFKAMSTADMKGYANALVKAERETYEKAAAAAVKTDAPAGPKMEFSKIKSTTADGDKAVVLIEYKLDGKDPGAPFPISCTKEEGSWRVTMSSPHTDLVTKALTPKTEGTDEKKPEEGGSETKPDESAKTE